MKTLKTVISLTMVLCILFLINITTIAKPKEKVYTLTQFPYCQNYEELVFNIYTYTPTSACNNKVTTYDLIYDGKFYSFIDVKQNDKEAFEYIKKQIRDTTKKNLKVKQAYFHPETYTSDLSPIEINRIQCTVR